MNHYNISTTASTYRMYILTCIYIHAFGYSYNIGLNGIKNNYDQPINDSQVQVHSSKKKSTKLWSVNFSTSWFWVWCLPVRKIISLSESISRSIFLFPLLFWFCKRKSSSFLLFFLSLQAQGALYYFLISLFGLQAQGALYRSESFYNTSFNRPWLDTAYIRVYNYVI